MIEISIEKRVSFVSIRTAMANILECSEENIAAIDDYWATPLFPNRIGIYHVIGEGDYPTLVDLQEHSFEYFPLFEACRRLCHRYQCKVSTFLYSDQPGPDGEDSLVFCPNGSVLLGVSWQGPDGFSVRATQDAMEFDWIRKDIPRDQRLPFADKAIQRYAFFETSMTMDYPFHVDGKGWTAVEDMGPCDQLISADGAPMLVKSIEAEGYTAATYNLTVANAHTFFVGEERLWRRVRLPGAVIVGLDPTMQFCAGRGKGWISMSPASSRVGL